MPTIDVMVEGGKATPGPPLGPALGPLGVNAGKVVAEINAKTKQFEGMKVPVKVIVHEDKTFTIEVGVPPASQMILKEAKLDKGSGKAGSEVVGDISLEALVKIAKSRMDKTLAKDVRAAVKELLGTCLSMGLTVNGKDPREIDVSAVQ
ncbi:50S ribosomal protein L11 [Nanoarchaeota archaeon]|nr:MAG: 50S ribosomal protein L11 [Nanoarchaeota archaeon]